MKHIIWGIKRRLVKLATVPPAAPGRQGGRGGKEEPGEAGGADTEYSAMYYAQHAYISPRV